MRLAIVIINYNSSENTIKLLKSLENQADTSTSLSASKDFQIIVVDNASEEADFVKLSTSQVDNLRIIRNDQNLGFSGGNNVGIKKALEKGAEWVLLLNNDTWVEPGFIASIKAVLSRKHGILGLPMDEGGRTSYCGKIRWLKPTLEHNYELRITNYELWKIYVIGGAIAIHKDIFKRIGFLDEKYFLYFEDVDYSIRARKNNIPIEILEKPIIHHTPSSTTKKLRKPLLLRYHYRNALYFNLKNGPWHVKLLVWPWSWIIILKQIIKIMIYHNREESSSILKGVFDFYKNKMGKI